MLVGCHPKNTTNSTFNTIKSALDVGSNVVQIFLKSPHLSTAKINLKKYDYYRITKLKHKGLYVHASYLINLCNKPPPSERNVWAINLLVEDLQITSKLNGKAVTVHVGKSMELSTKQALDNMKQSIEYVLQVMPKDVDLYLETPAGSGTEVLYRLEDLAQFYKSIKSDNFKICVDTCHIFVAGYPIHTIKGMQSYFKKFDKLIGIKNIGLIHLNDSTYPLDSRKDKHAELTEGHIFKDLNVLKYLVQFCKGHNIPLILETHVNFDDQIHLLKSFEQVGGSSKVIDILKEMAKIHQYLGDNNRAKAYINAIWQLKDVDLTNIGKIKGIDKIALKITEILDTGKLLELERLKKDKKVQTLILLNSVMGIGPKYALELYNNGIRKIKDIKLSMLNPTQRLGLKYYDDLKDKITRDEMNKWHKIFQEQFFELKYIFAGSYLRGAREAHDLDVLIISSKDVRDLIRLKLKDYYVDDISSGVSKMSILIKINKVRRLDILIVPKESYPTALLYMTGSKALTLIMRNKAKKMGYLLNEFGIYRGNKMIPVGNEKDVFKLLEMKYLRPEDRSI